MPSTLVASHLARGELVTIVMLERKLLAPAVSAFVELVSKRAPVALTSSSAAGATR